MKYISTRGQSPALSFSEILLGGLAPDGGLYLPENYPQFSDADLSAMRDMNYRDLAFTILSRLIDEQDIPSKDLMSLLIKHIALRFIAIPAKAKTLKTLRLHLN
jgi:threonine synthase